MNKKLYPWLPLVGIPLTIKSDVSETGLDKNGVNICSGLLQGVYIGLLIVLVLM